MYTQTMIVDDKHIDFQGIMDGLYYPYYMEIVRHQFLKDIVGIDLVEESKDGFNYVLSSIENMNFKRPIKANDTLEISCKMMPIDQKKFGFFQEIKCNGKVMCDANFTATCIHPNGRSSTSAKINDFFESLL